MAVVAATMLSVLAACNDDEISSLPESDGSYALYGTWATCQVGDFRNAITFNPSGTATQSVVSFTSTDGSCSGTPGTPGTGTLSFSIGNPITVSWFGNSVSGRELNINIGGTITYTSYFINGASEPYTLYVADENPPNDGSTPALRSKTMETNMFFYRQ